MREEVPLSGVSQKGLSVPENALVFSLIRLFFIKIVFTWMSPDVVLQKKLFRDVALVAAADGARVRVVAGVSSNVNAETKTKKTLSGLLETLQNSQFVSTLLYKCRQKKCNLIK